MQPRHTGFIHRRNLLRRWQPPIIHDGIGPDAAGSHMRQRIGCEVDHEFIGSDANAATIERFKNAEPE
jgi:hypothetical protein